MERGNDPPGAKGNPTAAYPAAFLERFEPLQRLSLRASCETLLVRERATERYAVARCAHGVNSVPHASSPAALPSHPSLPEILDRFEDDRTIIVVRAYVEGASLEEVVERGAMTPRIALSIADQLLGVLALLHEAQPPIVHRSLNPQHVILATGGAISLIGIDAIYGGNEAATHDTAPPNVRAFLAPEQLGYDMTDARADIYSFGVLLRYLLTKRIAPGTVPEGGRSMARFLARCTAYAPADRYPTARAARQALHRMRFAERNAWRLGIAAAALCAFAIGGIAGWLSGGVGASPDIAAFADGGNAANAGISSAKPSPIPLDSAATTPPSETLTEAPTVTPTPAREPIVFREPLIEKAVRLSLGMDDVEPITDADLRRVQTLRICADAAFADEETYQEAASPMANLSYGPDPLPLGTIESLEDLRRMTGMRVLQISAQPLSDISALSGMTSLETLDLQFTGVQDLSPLRYHSVLHRVDLTHTNVTDLSMLPKKALRSLRLDLIHVDPAYFRGIHLDDLVVMGRDGTLEGLRGAKIYMLTITGWEATTLDALRDIEGLECFSITNAKVTDITPLAELDTVRFVNLGMLLNLKDLSPLLRMPHLTTLELHEAMRDAAKKSLPEDVPFEVVFPDA